MTGTERLDELTATAEAMPRAFHRLVVARSRFPFGFEHQPWGAWRVVCRAQWIDTRLRALQRKRRRPGPPQRTRAIRRMARALRMVLPVIEAQRRLTGREADKLRLLGVPTRWPVDDVRLRCRGWGEERLPDWAWTDNGAYMQAWQAVSKERDRLRGERS